MEYLIPEAEDGSEFIEQSYDMSQAQAETAFGAEFESDADTEQSHGGVDHD